MVLYSISFLNLSTKYAVIFNVFLFMMNILPFYIWFGIVLSLANWQWLIYISLSYPSQFQIRKKKNQERQKSLSNE